MQRHLLFSSLIWLSSFLCVADVHADAPYELYHVARSSIPKTVLRKIIGILTISNGYGKDGKQIPIFNQVGRRWEFAANFDAAETVPVSNFDYHPSMDQGISNYRFPILEISGEYRKIVVEPVSGKSVWVSTVSLSSGFYFEEIYLDALVGSKQTIDFSFGEDTGPRRLYDIPSRTAESTIVSQRILSSYKILDQRAGFLQLGEEVAGSEKGAEKSVKPVGWIPIRDEDGCLDLWIVLEDSC